MSVDFTKWSVEQMREELCKLTGLSMAEASAIKGKQILAERIVEARGGVSASFSDIQVETQQHDFSGSDEEELPLPRLGSPEWQDHVMSMLTDDECETRCGQRLPRANGLRRVAQQLLGPIVNSAPTQIFPPSKGNNVATVVYNVSILWTYDSQINNSWLSNQDLAKVPFSVRNFSEVADAHDDNTPEPFSFHLSATASSRAEGRALRKALQLNVVTAEEMSGADLTKKTKTKQLDDTDLDNEKINGAQLSLLNSISERLSIDLSKALAFHNLPSDVNSLTRGQAAQVSATLNKYQTNGSGSLEIPDVIKKTVSE